MKTSSLAYALLLATFPLSNLHAESLDEQTRRAAELNDRGNFKETIEILAPLLQSHGKGQDGVLGVAWNINGLALQSTGNEEGARRSYERAIEILGRNPTERHNLAAALDNLGSLDAEMGQFVESQRLRSDAKMYYEAFGDEAGVARTSINLALVAFRRGNRKRMRQLLDEAFSAEARVAISDAGDLAALYNAQALERRAFGDSKGALESIDRAIQIWMEHYGAGYYLLANGYSLRAQLEEANLNYRERAMVDDQRSLEILVQHGDKTSRVYFLIEVAYAKLLRQSGMENVAGQLESDAKIGLESLHRTACAGCTISADNAR